MKFKCDVNRKIVLQKVTMQRFPVCFPLLHFETKKFTQAVKQISILFFNFTKDILEDYSKYDISVASNDHIHSLTFRASARSPIQNVNMAKRQISVPALKLKYRWYDYERRTKRRKSKKTWNKYRSRWTVLVTWDEIVGNDLIWIIVF